MNEDEIRGLIYHLEEIGASSDVIDEVVAALPKDTSKEGTKSSIDNETLLVKQAIAEEPDWRRRASMVAGIISNNLDNGY